MFYCKITFIPSKAFLKYVSLSSKFKIKYANNYIL